MWPIINWFIIITSAIAFAVVASVVLRVVVALVLLAIILALHKIEKFFAPPRYLEPLRFTPEQWAAWNARSERVRDDQIRRKQLFLLPPPSAS